MKKVVSCTQCGAKMRAGIKLCAKCGYRLKDEQAEAMAVAAQAEEAAANLLTEEEIAAREAEAAAAASAQEPSDAAEERNPSRKELSLDKKTKAAAEADEADVRCRVLKQQAKEQKDGFGKQKRELNHNAALYRQKLAAEKKLAKQLEKDDKSLEKKRANAATQIAKTKAKSNLCRQKTEHNELSEAERVNLYAAERAAVELTDANAMAKADRVASEKLYKERISADKQLRKQQAANAKKLQRQKNASTLRAAKVTAAEDVKEANTESFRSQHSIVERSLDNRRTAKEAAAERRLLKQRASDADRLSAIKTSAAHSEQKQIGKSDRADLKADLRESDKTAKLNRNLERQKIEEKNLRNRMLAKDVANERKKMKRKVAAEERLNALRANAEARADKKFSADRAKATRALLNEEAKVAGRENDQLKSTVKSKMDENRLYAKTYAAEQKRLRKRAADMEKAAKERAAKQTKEMKVLGAVELKAAKQNLTDEGAAARRQAEEVARDTELRAREEKLNVRKANDEKRLIRQRANDKEKNARLETAIRSKETKKLGQAERKSLKVGKSDSAQETRRKADEVKLAIQQKAYEEKLYTKKIAAERKLIKRKAADSEKLQNAQIRDAQMLQSAQSMSQNRAEKENAENAVRALRAEKNQNTLHDKRTAAENKIAKREHKLELNKANVAEKHAAKVMSVKEKEQRMNIQLAEKYEKEAVKRAKRIAKVSGKPVSLIPALTGTGAVDALTGAKVGVPSLENPDQLLANSFEDNLEQYKSYKNRKKEESKRLRYVEIGVSDEKKYFRTLYQDGEVMVAKRNVYISRIQAILAILLMVVALIGSLMPMYSMTIKNEDPVAKRFYSVLNEQGIISFESIMTDGQSDGEGLEYLQAFLEKVFGKDFAQSHKNGIETTIKGITNAIDNKGFFTYFVRWAVFLLLAIAIVLTPFLILINLVIAVIRLICHAFGKGPGITRIMKNLRGSYALIGFMLLPYFFMKEITNEFGMGFLLYIGSFAASILLMLVLNLFKKCAKSDKKYLRTIRWNGLIRLLLLAVFFIVLGGAELGYLKLTLNAEDLNSYITIAVLAVSILCLALSALAFNSLGFEIVGYTKGKKVSKVGLLIFGFAGAILPLVLNIVFKITAIDAMSLLIGIGCMAGILICTLFTGIVRFAVIRRNRLVDPILNALHEGYPLK